MHRAESVHFIFIKMWVQSTVSRRNIILWYKWFDGDGRTEKTNRAKKACPVSVEYVVVVPRCFAGIVYDGFHVTSMEYRIAMKAKARERIKRNDELGSHFCMHARITAIWNSQYFFTFLSQRCSPCLKFYARRNPKQQPRQFLCRNAYVLVTKTMSDITSRKHNVW